MNYKKAQEVLDCLNSSKYGKTIKNLMNETGYARGTIRPILDLLVYCGDVSLVKYNQNVKVYFAEIQKIREVIIK